MLLTTVSLVPVAVALALALGLFGVWVTYLIRADQRLAAPGRASAPAAAPAAASAPAPAPAAAPAPVAALVPVALAEPVVAVVAPVPSTHERPHYLVAAPDPVVDPEPEPPAQPELPELPETPEQLVVVRSGSFCTVVGALGVTANGTEMVCSSANGARPRWRRAVRELQRSA